MPRVAIFGAGIAGCTVAHELVERGFQVDVYEASDTVGGMAKSRRLENGVPTEHSWRGYAPFYHNLYAMMRRIPYRDTESNTLIPERPTVYDQLSRPVVFHLAKNRPSTWRHSLIHNLPSIWDTLQVTHNFSRVVLADERKADYQKIRVCDYLGPHLTEAGRNYYQDFLISPGWGMDRNRVTLDLYYHFADIIFYHGLRHWSIKRDPDGDYVRYPFQYWHTMRRPTSEAFLEPWRVYLEGRGVRFHFHHALSHILVDGPAREIRGCRIRIMNNLTSQRETVLEADEYVFAVNPYHFHTIIARSNLLTRHPTGQFAKFAPLTEDDPYDQVSFRLGFRKKLRFPRREMGIFLADSPFCILLYPQDSVWDPDVSLGNIGLQSLWSGTCCGYKAPSALYGKRCDQLTREEFMQEILHQVFQAEDLFQILEEANGFRPTREDLVFQEIWGEWYYDGERLRTTEPEWTTLSKTNPFRPHQKTEYVNAWLAGSHTRTDTHIWTMEGAAESGRSAARALLEKHNVTPCECLGHSTPTVFRALQKVDNGLYRLGLPSLADVSLVILVAVVIFLFLRKTRLFF